MHLLNQDVFSLQDPSHTVIYVISAACPGNRVPEMEAVVKRVVEDIDLCRGHNSF